MKEELVNHFLNVRQHTEALCSSLPLEDYSIQGMEDVSPPKWHLAHTAWFFEAFILQKYAVDYDLFHPSFHYLFNSYYQGMGKPFPRAQRGLLSRPLIEEVYEYRHYITQHILKLLDNCSSKKLKELQPLILLGLEHEQQHQELLLMDVKYNLSLNPDFPAYHQSALSHASSSPIDVQFIEVPGGMVAIGHRGKDFCYDNELPCHNTILNPFAMASRLVTNKEYLQFIEDGGYLTPTLWLSDGWDWIVANKIDKPLYWHFIDSKWWQFTLSGLKTLHWAEPVAHISFFEADAFARWQGLRLPTEEEWEYFVDYAQLDLSAGNFMEQNIFHPLPATAMNNQKVNQFFGDLWEWTSSTYSPYPGYKPLEGNLGEYNGKFMNNQRVLRGGSCVTPYKHLRKSYRNFFQPDKRWPFCGIRLARDN